MNGTPAPATFRRTDPSALERPIANSMTPKLQTWKTLECPHLPCPKLSDTAVKHGNEVSIIYGSSNCRLNGHVNRNTKLKSDYVTDVTQPMCNVYLFSPILPFRRRWVRITWKNPLTTSRLLPV